METTESRLLRLAAMWQHDANTKIATGEDAEAVYDALLSVALGNLVQCNGPEAVANSLKLLVGMLISNAPPSATVARH